MLRKVIFLKQIAEVGTNLEAPNEFGGQIIQRSEESYVDSTGKNLLLKGIACGPGVYEGKARVALTLEEASHMEKGEILVTKFTDPGWTPILGMSSAVVTEVGGVLSHAAVIGREYGIPAVLNITGATKHIRTGQLIKVDGNNGTVLCLN